MGFILYLIIGGIIGWLAGLILCKDLPCGIIGNIIAGIIGAWIGGSLFGSFGPEVWGMSIIPAFIGAILLVLIVSLIMRALRK